MKSKFLLLVLLSTFLFSCKNESLNSLLPTVTGSSYDILVVGSQTLWQDTAGKFLFEVLDDDVPGLPQSEPLFNISYIPTKDFSGILKPVRNIVIFDVDEHAYTQGRISYVKDRWARTQTIAQITAPTQEEMIRVINENKDELVYFFVDAESARSLDFFRRYSNSEGEELVRKIVNVDLVIPNFLNKYKVGDKFIWLSNGSGDSRQDVVVYRTPYIKSTDFSMKSLLARRDSVMQIYIPGPSEGSYMTTEQEDYMPTYKEFMVNGKYCVEVRGLWRVEGDLMGGPFVSRTFCDEKNGELVTVETFVYAPRHKKRNKLRQMESILYSVKID